jgi:hypothetical protein
VQDLNVGQPPFPGKPAGEVNSILASLYPHHATLAPDTFGQEIKAALRSATYLDDTRPWRQSDLIKKPACLVGELLGLPA